MVDDNEKRRENWNDSGNNWEKRSNCSEELKSVFNADYDLCAALLTMVLREDHFSNGSFKRRFAAGQVLLILKRMRDILSMK